MVPQIKDSNVDLPEPLSPKSKTVSPPLIEKFRYRNGKACRTWPAKPDILQFYDAGASQAQKLPLRSSVGLSRSTSKALSTGRPDDLHLHFPGIFKNIEIGKCDFGQARPNCHKFRV